MTTRTPAQRIHVAPSRSGWIVSVRTQTHAVFVGTNARERAVEWALKLAESVRLHGPVVVDVDGTDDRGPTHSHDRNPRGRLAS
jgi:hypothetical protein